MPNGIVSLFLCFSFFLLNCIPMYCPICNHKETKVIDSRIHNEGAGIRRRRQCEKCEYRFSTTEDIELLGLTVIKRDGRRAPYERAKLLRGLQRSLEKRPYTEASFKKLLHHIERDIQKKRSGEITSAQLGDIVMRHLRRFDKIAYIRFASVYQSFEELEDLERELHSLMRKRKAKSS